MPIRLLSRRSRQRSRPSHAPFLVALTFSLGLVLACERHPLRREASWVPIALGTDSTTVRRTLQDWGFTFQAADAPDQWQFADPGGHALLVRMFQGRLVTLAGSVLAEDIDPEIARTIEAASARFGRPDSLLRDGVLSAAPVTLDWATWPRSVPFGLVWHHDSTRATLSTHRLAGATGPTSPPSLTVMVERSGPTGEEPPLATLQDSARWVLLSRIPDADFLLWRSPRRVDADTWSAWLRVAAVPVGTYSGSLARYEFDCAAQRTRQTHVRYFHTGPSRIDPLAPADPADTAWRAPAAGSFERGVFDRVCAPTTPPGGRDPR